MDIQLIGIIIIFGALFVFNNIDKENFNNMEQEDIQRSILINTQSIPKSTSVSMKNDTNRFGNFGIIGNHPPNNLCNSCNLHYNRSQYPYENVNNIGDEQDDKYQKVSLECSSIKGKNYHNLDLPFIASGRSIGRTRQCRRLL